jgi:elongator complex protein 1
MTQSFEVIAQVSLSPADVMKHINQVSVGWGRAETQFRGLRARNAPRDPTLPEKVDEGVLSPYDDGKVRLSWRGDGECLAFSRVEQEEDKPAKRVVRVYNRDGQIESFSEPIDGLEGVLGWRPSGNWIATVQRKAEEEADVVFLERNGLRHGGFQLRKPGNPIRELLWNADSSVLAVSLIDRIQLWMLSNYEWHLKQEIVILRENENKPFKAKWHPEKSFILFINTAGDQPVIALMQMPLNGTNTFWMFAKTRQTHHSILVLSQFSMGVLRLLTSLTCIEFLKLTPLRISNVPPPMAASELVLRSTPAHVSFESTGQNFAILRQRDVDFAMWTDFNTIKVTNPKIVHTLRYLTSDRF